MRLNLPPEAERYREEMRGWLAEHPKPSRRQLAEAGLVAPHWPRPWGRDAGAVEQLVIDEVLRDARVRKPVNPVGIGWGGPTVMIAGTPEQQQRWLPGILDGSELWCQLFSEPEAGSDLARLTTRAVSSGDGWLIRGQKVWTGMAQYARFGILLARTDPDVPSQEGITYFVCPMDSPGITIKSLREMTGESVFCEVFFDDVFLPNDCVVGKVHGGWELAKVTLANERVGLSGAESPWMVGPTADKLVDLARTVGGVPDPVWRQRLVETWIEAQVLEMLKLRMVAAAVQGRQPGSESSVRKLLTDLHGQRLFRLGCDLAGAHGMLADGAPFGAASGDSGDAAERWAHAFLFSPALTVGGGTAQVQRNIIGERILGLPREPDADAGLSWSEAVSRHRKG